MRRDCDDCGSGDSWRSVDLMEEAMAGNSEAQELLEMSMEVNIEPGADVARCACGNLSAVFFMEVPAWLA